jgi:hypothetical protein
MLHDMGFITSEILFYISIGLATFLLISIIWNIRLEIRIKKLMRGKNGRSLEDSFLSMDKDIVEYKNFRKELEKYLKRVEGRVATSVRGVETINFSAFAGLESGGKSFATALLNEKGDGVIISSLNARDKLSIFTKKITNKKPDVELSEEEQEALTKALKSCNL